MSTTNYPATWSIQQTNNELNENEGWGTVALTALSANEVLVCNLATFTSLPNASTELKPLVIVAKGTASTAPSTLLFSTTIYVASTLTPVDVYRLT